MSNLYQETILEELRNPHNFGELNNADSVVEEMNASCGDSVTVYVKYSDNRLSISDISWIGVGCAISQASMSLLSEKIKGMKIVEVQKLSQDDIEEMLGIEEITVGRIKCMMLGLKAVQKAIASISL